MRTTIKLFFSALVVTLASCGGGNKSATEQPVKDTTAAIAGEKIVSISGTTTEIICALGLEQRIAGVDVTSTYPESVTKLPNVGHNRNMSAEAIIALKPALVIGLEDNTSPELAEQLRAAHIRVILFGLEHSIAGAKALITAVADSLGQSDKAPAICNQIDADLKGTVALTQKTKVLFIYARGAGTMMAAGDNTTLSAMIQLAGGVNTATGFEDFKPLTPESLMKANPDVILMFDSGLASLGGMKGLLEVPGVKMTTAGKKGNVIEMDGQFLSGFGPRIGQAVALLSKNLNEVNIH